MTFLLRVNRYLLLITLFLLACGKKENPSSIGGNSSFNSPEKIQFSVKYDSALALKDIIDGDSDVFLDNIPFSMISNLNEKEKKNLDIYSVLSDSWSFVLNPYPNKAPYQIKLNNKEEFNPFAIREIRYALNFLMNRSYIVDEILDGAGVPALTPVAPGTPNAWKLELQAEKLGLSVNGNKELAIDSINKAMKSASMLPANKNRLVKKNGFWYFDNEPIKIKFVIRIDDPEGRLKLGNYFANLLEECGLKVEKLLWDGNKSNEVVYSTDPSLLQWQIYTETWGGGSIYPWQDIPIIQNQTSIWGNQPGWGESSWWNYRNEEADQLANDWSSNKIISEDEHWKKILRINEIALKEATRLYISFSKNFYIANKNNLDERLYYNYASGLSKDALLNAHTKNGILKVLQFSSLGGLYQSPWDPIGTRGFMDIYTTNLVQLVFDKELADGPFGQINENRVSIISTKSQPEFKKDKKGNISEIFGKILVDENALKYDPKERRFKKIGKNNKAIIETTFKVMNGIWHHGREIKESDYLYAPAFINEWSNDNGVNDNKFDSAYSSYWKPQLRSFVGIRFNKNQTITTWSNSFSYKSGLSNIGEIPTLRVNGNQLPGYAVPWELLEGIQSLILYGSTSGTRYGLSEKEGIQAIDLKSQSFVKDLRAKLVELASKRSVPEVLKGEVTPEEAVKNYNLVISFIDKYGHALIGYGPYMLTKLDVKEGYAELTAFRNTKYTEEKGKWAKIYKVSRLRIDSVVTQDEAYTGEEFKVTVNASEVAYPSDESKKATKGTVYALFINKDKETKIDAKANGDGTFTIKLDAEKAKAFKGAYTLVVVGALDGQFTDTKTTSVIFN